VYYATDVVEDKLVQRIVDALTEDWRPTGWPPESQHRKE
jgi:hypothetical protein